MGVGLIVVCLKLTKLPVHWVMDLSLTNQMHLDMLQIPVQAHPHMAVDMDRLQSGAHQPIVEQAVFPNLPICRQVT